MDYQKMDVALAAAVKKGEDPDERGLVVLVHFEYPLCAEEASIVEQAVGREGMAGQQVVTATLSTRAADALSDQPWVRYLRLSQQSRLPDPR